MAVILFFKFKNRPISQWKWYLPF